MRNDAPKPTVFADALRRAIHDNGVTLDGMAKRLRDRGTPVSLATLSYWQSGRSQPERAVSLAALAHLEDLLGLGDGELGRLLDTPRPRGRAARRDRGTIRVHAPAATEPARSELFDGLDFDSDSHLTRLSIHDRVEISRRGEWLHTHTRTVVRAERDGVDRIIVGGWQHDPLEGRLRLVPLRNCSIGRQRVDPGSRQVVAELLFDHPLSRHETLVVEWDWEGKVGRTPLDYHERHPTGPIREYLVEIHFDRDGLPASCAHFVEADGRKRVRPLHPDSSGVAHAIVLDPPPGRVGIRWSWDPSVPATREP